MSKYKIVNLIDKVFITVSIFLIVYAWINFFLRNLWITFLFSLVFTFACAFLLFYFLNKREVKKTQNKKYLKDVEQNFLAFQLMNKANQLNLIKTILNKSHKTEKIKDSLIFFHNNQTSQILISLSYEKLNQFELNNLIAKREKDVTVLKIICHDFEPNINTKILKNLTIEFITKKKLYDEFFLTFNTFPNCSNLEDKNEKIKFKILIKNFFIPRKAKSFFLCGLVLIFSSIILPYHYYYLIFGSLLLVFSIICKIQPLFRK